MTDGPIRVGIIGANVAHGWGTRAHIPALRAARVPGLGGLHDTHGDGAGDGQAVRHPARVRRPPPAGRPPRGRPRRGVRARAGAPPAGDERARGGEARLLRVAVRQGPRRGHGDARPRAGQGRAEHGRAAGARRARRPAHARADRGRVRGAGALGDAARLRRRARAATFDARLDARQHIGWDDVHDRRRALHRRAALLPGRVRAGLGDGREVGRRGDTHGHWGDGGGHRAGQRARERPAGERRGRLDPHQERARTRYRLPLRGARHRGRAGGELRRRRAGRRDDAAGRAQRRAGAGRAAARGEGPLGAGRDAGRPRR